MLDTLLAFEASEFPLVFACLSLLNHNRVGFAHSEVGEGELLGLFWLVDLGVVGPLPLVFLCSVWQGRCTPIVVTSLVVLGMIATNSVIFLTIFYIFDKSSGMRKSLDIPQKFS